MRHLLIALSAVLLLGMCTSCSRVVLPPFKRVPADQVDQAQLQTAERVAFRTLSAWRDGQFGPLGDDYSDVMKQALDSRQQRAAQESIASFGAFESLEFVEALSSDKDEARHIYRFRGSFSKSKGKQEIRVVMDVRGKVSGFWIKPWRSVMR